MPSSLLASACRGSGKEGPKWESTHKKVVDSLDLFAVSTYKDRYASLIMGRSMRLAKGFQTPLPVSLSVFVIPRLLLDDESPFHFA
jgi:hypothetical protein